MADKHTCRGCGTRTRKVDCPSCGRVWRELGEILAQDAREPVQATATQPAPQTGASGANSTLGDRMAWTIAPRHMHPGAEPIEVIQPEQWRLPKAPLLSFMDDAGEWLDEHPLLAVAGMGLALLVLLAICIVGGR